MSDDSDFMIDLDFSGVPRSNLLEEGLHTFTIEDISKQAAKKSDDPNKKTYPSLKVKYSTEEGQKLTDYMSMNPDSLWRIRIFLEAVTGEEFDGPINIDPRELIGSQVKANVTVEAAWNDANRQVNKIMSWVNIND